MREVSALVGGLEAAPARSATGTGSPGRLTAAAVMSSPVVAVTPEHDLLTAWEAMRVHRVHHVAVVVAGRVVGILDDRTVAARWPVGGPEAAHRRLVAEIVQRGVQCVLPDAPVAVVARLMRRAGTDAVPVISGTGELVGLVTATDLVAVLADEFGCLESAR